MDCITAQREMQQRIDDRGASKRRDFKALDAHLATCSKCAAEWLALVQTREQLVSLREDAPTTEETTAMWQTIDAALPTPLPNISTSMRSVLPRLFSAPVAVAACLLIAFVIGQQRYGDELRRVAANHNLRQLAQSGLTYATDDPQERFNALWSLVQANDNTPKGYICPSSGDTFYDDFSQIDHDSIAQSKSLSYGVTQGEIALLGRDDGFLDGAVSFGHYGGLDARSTDAVDGDGVADLDDAIDYVPPDTYGSAALFAGDAVQNVHLQAQLDGGGREDSPAPTKPMTESSAGVEIAEPRPQSPHPNHSVTATKIIKTGELTTEIEDYSSAAEEIAEITTGFDAEIVDASTQIVDGGALQGELVIRVAPEQFESLFAALRAVGRVISEEAKSADVTADFVDVEARIAALKITEARLIELIQSKTKVDRVEDLLKVEQEMNRVRTEIERFEGQRRVMVDRVARSTITLRLHEPQRPVPSANLTIEVPSLDDAAAKLSSVITELDGRMLSGEVSKPNSGGLTGNYRLRIMLDRFGDALAKVSALGRVSGRNVSDWRASRATQRWETHVPCELTITLSEPATLAPGGTMVIVIDAFEAARDQLAKLVEKRGLQVIGANSRQQRDGTWIGQFRLGIKARVFDDTMTELSALGKVSSRELHGMGLGSSFHHDEDALGVVTLTLGEKAALAPEPDRAGGAFRRYLRDGLSGLWNSLGMITFGIIVMLPWLIVVVLVAWLIKRMRNRRAST
jgi:hypothetical protein